MSLSDFFEKIGPYLLAKRDHQDVVLRLYGESPPPVDAQRLRIYQRFCAYHRHEVLDSIFAYSRAAILAHAGEAGWDDIVARYFVAHPMHYFELNQNGEFFPAFVADLVAAQELPAFLGELADFEWWEWLTDTLLDDPADTAPGPLRLHSTVELRPYTYDFIEWIDEDNRQSPQPAKRDGVALFWRNSQLKRRREWASRTEMLIIKAVVESIALDDELAGRLSIAKAALDETVADLHTAGILLGPL